jgi:ferritin-like metal-binding protein YciE
MGEDDAASVLEQTLKEEKDTDEKLTELSVEINPRTFTGNGSEAETQNGETKVRTRAAEARGSR